MDLNLLKISTVAAVAVALVLELSFRSSALLGQVSDALARWRSFTLLFVAILAVGQILVYVLSMLGAHLAASFWSRLAHFFILPVEGKTCGSFRSVASRVLMSQAMKPGGRWDVDDQLLDLLQHETTGWSSAIWVLGAAMLAGLMAGFHADQHKALLMPIGGLLCWRSVVVLNGSIDVVLHACLKAESISVDDTSMKFIVRSLKIVLAALGGIFVASNCGVDVSSTLAGFGLSGLLLGLASQALLQDLFAWAIIITQKPFIMGDFVSLCGAPNGNVVRMDYQSTWTKATSGETMIFPNSKVISSPMTNFSYVKRRRMDVTIEVSALTSAETLARVTDLVRGVVEKQECCEYVSCWLKEVAGYALCFELLYYVNHGDMNVARETNTTVWVGILASFEENDISLAAASRLKAKAKKAERLNSNDGICN